MKQYFLIYTDLSLPKKFASILHLFGQEPLSRLGGIWLSGHEHRLEILPTTQADLFSVADFNGMLYNKKLVNT